MVPGEALAYQGDLLETLMRIVGEQLDRESCGYEHSESSYGCGDAQPCGRDAISNEDGQARCERHLGE